MNKVTSANKSYELDSKGFLADHQRWDENFAIVMAKHLGMPKELTKEHWDAIRFIRDTFAKSGRCPNVYETCRICGLSLKDLVRLFPTGYLRGACKLAGVTYKQANYVYEMEKLPLLNEVEDINVVCEDKIYKVDVRGFLIDPNDWDIYYAVNKALEMGIPGGKLTEKHWYIIYFLRETYTKHNYVPTVYETCEKNNITLEELEQLFPAGYHRGLIKIAGLRVI